MHIVADPEISDVEEAFGEFGTVERVPGRALHAGRLQHAHALLVRSVTRVDAALLEGTPVRFVGSVTAGTDHVDTDYLESKGISFAAAPGCNARAVAEYILACVMLFLRRRRKTPTGVRAGIIGYGHTGGHVAALLRAVGVACVLHDPPRAARDRQHEYAGLEEVLDSDIVTLHVPLTEDGPYATRNLLDADRLRRLRPGALLINTARGGVVDEVALVRSIGGPHAVMAAVDCWTNEPALDRELLRVAFVATPHVAGHSARARHNAAVAVHRACAAFVGRDPRWRSTVAVVPQRLDLTGGDPIPLGMVARAVLASHDPHAQSLMLRRAVGLPASCVGRYFDEVRRRLGMRREFSDYRVASHGLAQDTIGLLGALGFQID